MAIDAVVNAQTTDVALLWLITVTDPSSNVVLRGVNNLRDVTSRGDVYTAFPFDLVLPPDTGDRPQNLQLSVANVGRELIQVLRGQLAPPRVKLELITSAAPNTVEKALDFFTVRNATYDAMAISFTLSPSNIFARKTMTANFNSLEFPAMFWTL